MKFKMLPLCLAASVLVACGGDDGESDSTATLSIFENGTDPGDVLEARVVDTDGFVLNDVVFTWMADGVAIADQTGQTYEIGSDALGSAVTVSASFTDFEGNDESPSSSNSVDIPLSDFDGEAELTGTAGVGEELSVSVTDLNGISSDITYVWSRGDEVIAGADASTYTTVDLDIGSIISVTASYVDDNEFTGSATAALESVIAASAGSTQVAQISDTNVGGTVEDTGELRYNLESNLTQGKLTVSFYKNVATNTDDPAGNQDAYITLYGPTTSSGEALIDLRIQDDNFLIRGRDDITFPFDFVPDTWYDVEITWDVTQTDMLTLKIDGYAIGGEGFSSGAIADSDVTDLAAWFAAGVSTVQFRFSDNSRVVPDGSYFVDDLAIYSDVEGTIPEFNDDFESYDVGDSLDTDNSESEYSSSTTEAEVAVLEASSKGPGNIGNQIAQISDTNVGGTVSDTGELRYNLESDLTQGKLSVYFLKNEALNTDDPAGIQDAYITLYGPTTSSGEALIDLRIQDDNFAIRGLDVTFPFDFVVDTWYHVEISWDVTVTDMITLKIDGQTIGGGAFSSGAIADSDVTDLATWFAAGVSTVQFRFSDNDRIVPDGSFYVDEVLVFSDSVGSTAVFTDDFESYEVGDSLDTDNPVSEYSSSTTEAIVSVEQ